MRRAARLTFVALLTAATATLVGSNAISARRWFVGGSDRLKAIVASSFKTFGIAICSRPETRPGGELGVVYTDAPSFHIIDYAIYHTDLDSATLVPEPGLEAAVRAFAKIIDEVNMVEIGALRGAPRASSLKPQA